MDNPIKLIYVISMCLAGGKHDPTRLRVRQWVEEYAKARGVGKYIAGQVKAIIALFGIYDILVVV